VVALQHARHGCHQSLATRDARIESDPFRGALPARLHEARKTSRRVHAARLVDRARDDTWRDRHPGGSDESPSPRLVEGRGQCERIGAELGDRQHVEQHGAPRFAIARAVTLGDRERGIRRAAVPCAPPRADRGGGPGAPADGRGAGSLPRGTGSSLRVRTRRGHRVARLRDEDRRRTARRRCRWCENPWQAILYAAPIRSYAPSRSARASARETSTSSVRARGEHDSRARLRLHRRSIDVDRAGPGRRWRRRSSWCGSFRSSTGSAIGTARAGCTSGCRR
jgi:hypothetical protein